MNKSALFEILEIIHDFMQKLWPQFENRSRS